VANINQRANGQNPLHYQGVPANQPTDFVTRNRDPLSTDSKNFFLGTWWLNTVTYDLWYLANVTGVVATWINLKSGAGINKIIGNTGGAVSPDGSNNINFLSGYAPLSIVGNPGTNTLTINSTGVIALQFNTDSGNAIPAGGILNVFGGLNINTSGAGNTVTVKTPTLAQGVIYANSSGVYTSLSKGTNGQLLIGSTAGVPAWANLTSTGATVTITNGANTINLAVPAAPPPITTTVAFSAYKSTVTTNVTGDGTVYNYICNTELFDLDGSYNNATGIFSAPSNGNYLFYTNAYLSNFSGIPAIGSNIGFIISNPTPSPSQAYPGATGFPNTGLGYLQQGGWMAVALVTGQRVQPRTNISSTSTSPVYRVVSIGSTTNRSTMFAGYKL
jgi:hypothetical protein